MTTSFTTFLSSELPLVHNVRHTDIKFPVALRHTPFWFFVRITIIIKTVGYTINKTKTDRTHFLLSYSQNRSTRRLLETLLPRLHHCISACSVLAINSPAFCSCVCHFKYLLKPLVECGVVCLSLCFKMKINFL